jgi:hypothetical protein
MTELGVTVLVAVVGFLGSLASSLFIAGIRWGTVRTRLEIMEREIMRLASQDQLAGVKEDVAEIKGMFKMTLRDGQSID